MKLNEMEKRLIFQADATTKSEITYELRRCLPYITDLEKRLTAANLVRKLDGMAWLVIAFLISLYGLPMLAIRRMNDTLCMEHGLSIVENPKPSRDHYGTWLGEQKQPSHQEQLRWAIDAALAEKPKDFEEFLKLLQASGIEVNRERKHLWLRTSPEHRYARCDTLKGDYTEQARTDMKELHNVRANVEYLLEIHTEQTPQHSTEKDRH